MIPTEEEHAVRQQVINRITNVINQYLPAASVRTYFIKKISFVFLFMIRLMYMEVIKRDYIYQ